MTPMLRRWLRFNAVGVAGTAVQFILLWLIAGAGAPKPLAAAFAVEAAVIHNFFWHECWTWRDLTRRSGIIKRFARFNFSNGAISIIGNVLIMWFLANRWGLPYIAVNGVAVLACSLLNFLSSDRFVFRHGV
jgi:putative flippase GtrA